MTKKTLLASLLLLFTCSIHAQDWFGNSKTIKGNGNIVTVNRKTSDYEGVSAGGSFEVILVKGKQGTIVIKGEENIIPFLETEVNNGILKIKFNKNTNIRTTKRLTITVAFEEIKSVALGGSGNITGKESMKASDFNVSLGGSGNINIAIDAETTTTTIGGSGDIELTGTTSEFKCSIAGSGSMSAYDLITDEVDATIAGSGSIKITVKNKIYAKLVGSGSLYYRGSPEYIDSKSVGSGSIVEKN